MRGEAACFRVHAEDNVATLLAAAGPGPVPVRGAPAGTTVVLRERIGEGHKVALADIAAGEPVRKYGAAIGVASADIAAGEWVHLHNCRSAYDERSGSLDRDSGAPTDTPYR